MKGKGNIYRSHINAYIESCEACCSMYKEDIKQLEVLALSTPKGWLNTQYVSEISELLNKIKSCEETIYILNDIINQVEKESE